MTSVNALKGATFISTMFNQGMNLVGECVNALKGASFISTHQIQMWEGS